MQTHSTRALIKGVLQSKGMDDIMNALHMYSKTIEPDRHFECQFSVFQMSQQRKNLGKGII